ncbi:6183_t:CDS:2 [Funneliformis mosseae]|uniref:6183_t:CDS:1 n=1 Tax=Funneliformis mosseae TaxID=27381 RepID=A0A9N8V2K8_FUNMO|nr:6183_t:CDS:2 [Funneliformis mosseae]
MKENGYKKESALTVIKLSPQKIKNLYHKNMVFGKLDIKNVPVTYQKPVTGKSSFKQSRGIDEGSKDGL